MYIYISCDHASSWSLLLRYLRYIDRYRYIYILLYHIYVCVYVYT